MRKWIYWVLLRKRSFSFQMEVVEYITSEEEFFDSLYCIDCEVEEYCSFPNVDRMFWGE